jgi:LPS sulfotransferase NodH
MGVGRPYEYFNDSQLNEPFMLKLLGLPDSTPDLPDRIDIIVRTATTANGVFGAATHWLDLERLLIAVGEKQQRTLPLDGHSPGGLRSLLPELSYIWLRRENKVAQGISHYLAVETGRWSEPAGHPQHSSSQPHDIPFDFPAIARMVRLANYEEGEWRKFLAGSMDRTLELTYEDLASDFAGTVSRVLEFLDMPENMNIPAPSLRRQADARSHEWERRYREQALNPMQPKPVSA